MRNFRVIKKIGTGKFLVQKKGWFGWGCAIFDSEHGFPLEFDSIEEAEASFKELFVRDVEVVREWVA